MKTLITCILLLFSVNGLAMQPTPALSPVEVVTFQLKSLQTNIDGEGIAATFRFASPANKIVTGPLTRFGQLFYSVRYRAMLNHRSAEVVLVSENGLQAEILAEIIDQKGSIHHYKFLLSRQQQGEDINCWMTDSVAWKPRPGRSASTTNTEIKVTSTYPV